MVGGLDMQCIISGLETENKFKNLAIHPDVMDLARDIMNDTDCSLSTALKNVAFILVNDIKEKLKQERGIE